MMERCSQPYCLTGLGRICRVEPPSSSHTFSNSGLSEQHQQPGTAQSSGQAHSVSSKPFSQGGRRADAKAPLPLTLQARTGVLPFLGHAQPPADVPAQSGQRSWWQHQVSAVVQEAVKVCLGCLLHCTFAAQCASRMQRAPEQSICGLLYNDRVYGAQRGTALQLKCFSRYNMPCFPSMPYSAELHASWLMLFDQTFFQPLAVVSVDSLCNCSLVSETDT